MNTITDMEFKSRLVELVLGGSGSLPRKPLDRHILYVSAMLTIESGRTYAESELNSLLLSWVERFGDSFGLDHVSLRRSLVDEGYLQRDRAGRTYERAPEPPYYLDYPMRAQDLAEMVEVERAAREERKRQYSTR